MFAGLGVTGVDLGQSVPGLPGAEFRVELLERARLGSFKADARRRLRFNELEVEGLFQLSGELRGELRFAGDNILLLDELIVMRRRMPSFSSSRVSWIRRRRPTCRAARTVW